MAARSRRSRIEVSSNIDNGLIVSWREQGREDVLDRLGTDEDLAHQSR
jgi:hypothetical protein